MPFHLAAYTQATGGAVVDTGSTAATDSELSQRNSHYILTEDYRLLATCHVGATITRANITAPSWNAVGKVNSWPINRSVAISSPPRIDSWLNYPLPLPQNEEISVNITDSASEQATSFLWLGSNNWNQNLPRGKGPLPIMEIRLNFTAASITQNLWSGLQSVTFEQSLRGGTYSIVGCECFAANVLACRLVFPRAPMYQGRKLRPGFLCQQALGDLPAAPFPDNPLVWGEYGRFSTFEPPQVEFWINTTGTPAIEMRWWVVWLTDDMNVTYGY